jgi:type VI secretion system FHA domain protein
MGAPPVGGNPFGGNPFGGAPFTPPAPPPFAAPPAAIPDDFDDLIAPLPAATPVAEQPAPIAAPEPPVDAAGADADSALPVQSSPPVVEVSEPLPETSPVGDYVRPTVNPFVTVPPVANASQTSSDLFADIAADAIDAAEASDAPLPVMEPPPVEVVAPIPVATPTQSRTGSGAEAEAVAAFLDGMGMADLRLSDAELVLTMGRLGATLREMIVGLREILMTRSSIKSEFRIDQTMITAGKNNPLKFSISPELAVEAMAKSAVKGYLEADEAARQALDDIKAHEIGMVTGMEAALKGVLARLDPVELTTKIEGKGGLGAMFRGKKALYWETYEKMYAEISDQAENDFHDLFAREFAQAYKEQLKRLKEAKG